MSVEQSTAIQRKTRSELAVKERHRQALELRLAGNTFQEIADALGYKSKHGAFDAVGGALKEIIREPAEDLRKLELQRLDALHGALWASAVKGDPVSVAGCCGLANPAASCWGWTCPKARKPGKSGQWCGCSLDINCRTRRQSRMLSLLCENTARVT
jgi:hypothetical protein